jgi:hypothetical protein
MLPPPLSLLPTNQEQENHKLDRRLLLPVNQHHYQYLHQQQAAHEHPQSLHPALQKSPTSTITSTTINTRHLSPPRSATLLSQKE